MQTELPTILNVFETDYQLEYSESFTGNLHQETAIEGYMYCTSLQTAFQTLISESYSNFILTIGSTAVAIYCHGNNAFKVFDSHARDACGNSVSLGTCILLELSTLSNLVHYFQSTHYNALFELKGVQLNDNSIQTDSSQSKNCSDEYTPFNCSYTEYSLCFSVIKPSRYWNSNTLSIIVNGGKQLRTDNADMNLNENITADQLPKTLNVSDFEVGLTLCNTSNGVLLNTYQSRGILRQLIINNCENTGFVLSFLSYSIGCIFKPSKTSKYVYSNLFIIIYILDSSIFFFS